MVRYVGAAWCSIRAGQWIPGVWLPICVWGEVRIGVGIKAENCSMHDRWCWHACRSSQPALRRLALMPALTDFLCLSRLRAMCRRTAKFAGSLSLRNPW